MAATGSPGGTPHSARAAASINPALVAALAAPAAATAAAPPSRCGSHTVTS